MCFSTNVEGSTTESTKPVTGSFTKSRNLPYTQSRATLLSYKSVYFLHLHIHEENDGANNVENEINDSF